MLHKKTGRLAYEEVRRINLTLPNTSGIISINIPSSNDSALETEQIYSWLLQIPCGTQNNASSYYVSGWIVQKETTQETPQDYISYATNGVWYDALNALAKRRRAEPQDDRLKKDWEGLLASIGLESLAQKPLLECCSLEQ